MLKVAILGRANVGKSTLYNKLVNKKKSIVYDRPGVTRDVIEETVELGDYKFNIYDTAGFEDKVFFSNEFSDTVLQCADVILFVVADYLLKQDYEILSLIRKTSKKPNHRIVLLINKCDIKKNDDISDFLSLGIDEYIKISAEHNIGIADIHSIIIDECENFYSNIDESENELDENDTIKLAIIGKPNVGKSTFINNILQENRMITQDEPGTTRDSVDINFIHKNKRFILTDTPGVRKKRNITDNLEKISSYTSIATIKKIDVVLFMFEAIRGIDKQDFILINHALKNGKIVIIGANKYDIIKKNKDDKDIRKYIEYQCKKILVYKTPIVFFSALKDKQCDDILDVVHILKTQSRRKFTTSKLNKWLKEACSKHVHPLTNKRLAINFKYIVQSGINPLYFTIYCNYPDQILDSYISYLRNNLREFFKIEAIPISIKLAKSHNPYAKSK
ncbi:ribosome biogenesis GTPase Der [Anaplasmataceae bacterium AB001_6]|nr:ribosome biogenesis GTPase Der [Anaplasmataceae bacterium AB001_6]